MKRQSILRLILFAMTILLPMLSACDDTPTPPISPTVPAVIIKDMGSAVRELETQIILMNNCGGKADATQTVGRGRKYEHNVQWQVGGEFGAGGTVKVVDLTGKVLAHYGQSSTEAQSEVTGLELIAPPGTNTEFTLVWKEVWRIGYATAQGDPEQLEYRYKQRLEVELVKSEDLDECASEGSQAVSKPPPILTPVGYEDEFDALDERIWELWPPAYIKLDAGDDGALHVERDRIYTSNWDDSAGIRLKGQLDFTGKGTKITWQATIHRESFWSLMYMRVIDEEADRDLQFDCSTEDDLLSFSCDVKLRHINGDHIWAAGETILLTKGDWHDFTIVNTAPRQIKFFIDGELVTSPTFSDFEWNRMNWVVPEWTVVGWAGHDNLIHASLGRYSHGP